MSSALTRPLDFYKPTDDILDSAYRNASYYLHKMTGDPIDQCRRFLIEQTAKGGAFPIRDPRIVVNVRDEITGDRSEEEMTLRSYLRTVKEENLVIVPTLTAYLPMSEKESFLGKEIIVNMNRRGVFKKKKFEATMRQDALGESIYEALQSSAKYLNNSLSGLMSIPTTALFNRSAHPTLTSTCRGATSYANMHNEQFLGGNRPYFTPNDAIEHVTSICNMMDRAAVQHAVDSLGIHKPTADEAMSAIEYSLDRYSGSPSSKDRIRRYLATLDAYELAAVCYTGDFKHFADLNPTIAKQFLVDLCTIPDTVPDNAHVGAYERQDSDTKITIRFQNGFVLKGKEVKEIMADPVLVDRLDRHAWMFERTLDAFKPFIDAFWLSNILPMNHAYMDTVRRKSVPVSDTDSTIFTNQEWTKFVTGSYNFEEMSFRVGNAMTLLSAKIVSHFLKMMSANSNVDRRELGRVSMKNEYYFTVIMLTSVAKHYAGMQWGQEGNVLPKLKPEIKGVNLRNSAWPDNVREDVSTFIINILTNISEGRTMTRDEIFEIPLRTERNVIDKMYSGTTELYNNVPVKEAGSYKVPMSSAYGHHVLWNSVFAPKYGTAPEPPYTGVRVPVKASSPTEVKAMVSRIEDEGVRTRMAAYLKEHNKNAFTNIIVPHSLCAVSGIPKEIIPSLDRDSMLSNVNGAYYLILNSLGFFIRDKDRSICIYDLYHNAA